MTISASVPIVEVVAAIITRPDGSFLLTSRPEGKPYAGYWEFPGGKVEKGESLRHALSRELQEELGMQTIHAYPWITRVFTYTHATVRLHFFRVTEWHGTPQAREKQALSWQFARDVNVEPVLPANAPVLRALLLPPVYALTQAGEIGIAASLTKITYALQQGLRLIQIREKDMPRDKLLHFSREVMARAHTYDAKVLINGDTALSRELGADGVHFTSSQLMTLATRPEFNWCGASCHNAEELFHAAQLGLDFVVLGPVLPTLSHPDLSTLGWRKFAALIRDYSLPVYALGGLRLEDLATAQEHGGHGIAMMRGLTQETACE
ncbi:MAG: Nudix family hydrolase [Nitrosomonas sp.]|nr:Nudix family hydrolase [Nitrosomonas sp.]MDP1951869.1 Nudix family hydrolase [Nitrosomonas sp.]